ncbi:MAG TPA: hypothetical protein VIV11_18690 [Kofleriaceae bacterium]
MACGFPKPADVGDDDDADVDSAGPDDGGFEDAPDVLPAQCDFYAQTGCATGQKCTYIHDTDMPQLTGHIGCAPNGTVADKGACTYSAAPNGFDNCLKGSLCTTGTCSRICNPMAANTCGANASCAAIAEPQGAGICLETCSPLDDNIFRAGGTKPGTACVATQGCYGQLKDDPANPTRFSCAADLHITNRVVHRSPCDSASGCANGSGNPYLNGCSQGYQPMLRESSFVTSVVCIAFCKPATCYSGNCAGGNNAAGLSPHACNTTNAEGTFDPATATNNGDHCMFSWWFEQTATGIARSATSDTVGFCVNHKRYKYDSDGDTVLEATDADFPLCASAPLALAVTFGCVDSLTAGFPFTGKKPLGTELRLPYGRISDPARIAR